MMSSSFLLRVYGTLSKDFLRVATCRNMSVKKPMHPPNLYPRLESIDLSDNSSKDTADDSSKINFENHVDAFRNKTTWEIVRALTILKLCSINAAVDNSLAIMRWVDRIFGRRALSILFKPTVYNQFVGGETPREIQACIRRVAETGMRIVLAATLEEDVGEGGNEAVYNNNCKWILEAMEIATSEDTPLPMIQLKLSGLLSPDLLVTIGDVYKKSSDKVNLIRAISQGLTDRSIDASVFSDVLDEAKKKCLEKALERLNKICLEAKKKRVKLLVDAEYTYLNPGFSLLTLAAVNVFNKESSVVWNTYQCYLKDARKKVDEELKIILEDLNAYFGAKVVRGAYMVKERIRAQELQLPDPICDDYDATSNNYNSIISYLLEKTAEMGSRCQFMIASHNEQSVTMAISKMEDLNIDKQRGGVYFGQLYGMCDQLTYPLANAGYIAYKSIPYGTVYEVLPYLARRAVENKSLLEGARKEQLLLNKELKRRIKKKFTLKVASNHRSERRSRN